MSSSFWETYWQASYPERERRERTTNTIIRGDLERAILGSTDQSFAVVSMAAVKIEVTRLRWEDKMNKVYRVRVDPITKRVEVACLGMDSVDSEAEGVYANTSLLPDWMQGKLALLSMMKVDPPQTTVEGVGMRIDQNVFWVLQ